MKINDLPDGYRWANEEETDRPDAIVVLLTKDSNGSPYVDGEADVAVPIMNGDIVNFRPGNGETDSLNRPLIEGKAKVIGPLNPSTYDLEDVGPMFSIIQADGQNVDAFADELTPWEG